MLCFLNVTGAKTITDRDNNLTQRVNWAFIYIEQANFKCEVVIFQNSSFF